MQGATNRQGNILKIAEPPKGRNGRWSGMAVIASLIFIDQEWWLKKCFWEFFNYLKLVLHMASVSLPGEECPRTRSEINRANVSLQSNVLAT